MLKVNKGARATFYCICTYFSNFELILNFATFSSVSAADFEQVNACKLYRLVFGEITYAEIIDR